MKKIILAALATAAFAATPAAAQNSQTINLQGTVPLSCTVVANPSIVNPEVVDLTNSATDQSLGSLTYSCNNAGGFTRSISSANAGVLKRAGGAAGENNIPYQVGHTGGSGLTLANSPITSAITTNLAGSTAFIQGQTGSIRVRLGAPSGPLFAGNYGDVITVSVSAN